MIRKTYPSQIEKNEEEEEWKKRSREENVYLLYETQWTITSFKRWRPGDVILTIDTNDMDVKIKK